MDSKFILDYSPRITDNRSSSVIVQEMTKNANLKSTYQFKNFILQNDPKKIIQTKDIHFKK